MDDQPSPSAHLSPDARAVWDEMVQPFHVGLAGVLLESYCVLVARMRDAQQRIDAEGLIVDGDRGVPVAHPAIEVERLTSAEVERYRIKLKVIAAQFSP